MALPLEEVPSADERLEPAVIQIEETRRRGAGDRAGRNERVAELLHVVDRRVDAETLREAVLREERPAGAVVRELAGHLRRRRGPVVVEDLGVIELLSVTGEVHHHLAAEPVLD